MTDKQNTTASERPLERVVRHGDKIAENLYLALKVAENYPEQCPESKYAKWYDLFWFALPIVGFLIFVIQIEDRSRLNA